MAILSLPLVTSILKKTPNKYMPHISFLLTTAHRINPSTPPIFKRKCFSSTATFSRPSATTHSSASTEQESSKDNKNLVPASSVLTFQQAIQRLQEYWASVGCAVMQCSNTEVGAGTMNPLTFLRVLGPEPWNVAYVEPSIRPDDSRYGENPNRLQRHTQFQVILKPDPGNSQDLFIRSLSALGINVHDHDIRFVEDNWESPVLGAWGLGWEIWMDGMEITQFTYFQQAGSLQLTPVSVEITYGLERILMLLQGVDHFKKIQYADGITYGELFLENEKEMSAYYLKHASVDNIHKHFDLFEAEARCLLDSGLAIPAYDQLLKTSHAFNILDSRGFVGVTERARYFGRMRSLARQCAQLWLKTRESLGYPLGVTSQSDHIVFPKEVLEEAAGKVSTDPRLFVLEIGTEELPPNEVVNACKQLKDLIEQLLEKQRLSHGKVLTFGTPRRLVVHVHNLYAKQVANEIDVRGPPASKAFDQGGNPTKAAEGFCRRNGVPLGSLFRRVEGKTEYVYVRAVEPSRLALEVLSEELPGTIGKILFPKSMRWNSEVMFSRPIRWILALHGDVVVPFMYAGVLSGNLSHGLRNTPSATVKVASAESYTDVMQRAGIAISMEQRKQTILDSSNALAKSVGGIIILQNDLLDEVANLVEKPVPVLGKFNESFLELPKDLLIMVMQKHQKYFAITDQGGKLLPYFISVANGAINEMVVRKGNEAVLRARYEDAKFFYAVDTSKRFSEFRSQLNGILFHEKLGTMLDKMTRVQHLVTEVGLSLGVSGDTLQVIKGAASLAMIDLATAVVTEFTSLSGIMARHYALRDGYSEQIAEALFEITLPRFSGDILPKTDAGTVLAITDRLESLVGLFAAGCQPSSSNDPFGLRRISYCLVQLLVETNRDLDLRHGLELAAAVQPINVAAETIDTVHQFVIRRLEQLLMDQGISPEVVRSVLAERANQPCLATKSAYKMEALSRGELLPKIVEVYSRPTRIVRGKDINDDLEVDEGAFETKEEKALWCTFTSLKTKIRPDMEVDDFVEASSDLLQPLEDFFNNVFVMVEDERIRKNRLALLKKISDLPKGIADLSILPGF
ncbi:glycine--tRNA ligase, chloroplastic mitochondrial 2 isoform X1 [Olea europaea subsp. europaea]|uniref:glycine--tRNA ligase n=1 Tax=Olea europaea subsp. europaea TaxID=158383 RepID=A0A8S0SHT3_OLEEU|nr:glycine--tRNA ligase, chloroplastic mitochondrial 2 isoform X1 [Olea europaea subsp. europaea]